MAEVAELSNWNYYLSTLTMQTLRQCYDDSMAVFQSPFPVKKVGHLNRLHSLLACMVVSS